MEGKLMRPCSNSKEGKLKPKEEQFEQLILVHIALPTRVSEFYVLDLETEKITKKPVATLFNQGRADGYTVYLGSMIYCVGGHFREDMIIPKFIVGAGDCRIHLGTSRANLNIPRDRLLQTTDPDSDIDADAHAFAVARKGGLVLESTRFEAGPKLLYPRFEPRCAVLNGKIYAFGSSTIGPLGEVFEPEGKGEVGEWRALPPIPSSMIITDREHPFNLHVSNPVIPDHKNHRILVHVSSICHLFAYYPELGTWECLDRESMSEWYQATTLVDDVLYVHTQKMPNCFAAYDLSSKAWLKVSCDKSLYPQPFYAEFLNMLPLGNNVLCLANSCTYKNTRDDPRRSNLQFIRFKVERTSPQEVLFTLLGWKCFTLDGYMKAKHYILL